MNAEFLILTPMFLALAFVIGMIISIAICELNPYLYFKMHVFLVKLGLYRVKRTDSYFDIITGIETEVRFEKLGTITRNNQTGHMLNVKSRFNPGSFKFTHYPNTIQIAGFTSSDKFAKRIKNTEKFKKMLGDYLSVVMEKEYGKQSKKEILEEEMKNASLLTPLHEKPKPKTTAWMNYDFSSVIQEELASIQEKKDALKENIHLLDVEEKHAYEQIIHTRVPNLLKQFAEFNSSTQKEKEEDMKVTLQNIHQTMDMWLLKIQAQSHSDFEKERILIKELTK